MIATSATARHQGQQRNQLSNQHISGRKIEFRNRRIELDNQRFPQCE